MLNQRISFETSDAVQRAFSKQAEHYDTDDSSNQILIAWRQDVYRNIQQFLRTGDRLLELNAGTGIDALYFAKKGHSIHATDHAAGMVAKINQKIYHSDLLGKFTSQQCSFEALDQVHEKGFDYVFSNFGGLNCCKDLTKVTRNLSKLLNRNAHVTFVIMPRICPWEFLRLFKSYKNAFRRLRKGGTRAQLEGEQFQTYNHSLTSIKRAFGKDFVCLRCEGLGVVSPPPASLNFSKKDPMIYTVLKAVDRLLRNVSPFNRWGDHIIVTFQYRG